MIDDLVSMMKLEPAPIAERRLAESSESLLTARLSLKSIHHTLFPQIKDEHPQKNTKSIHTFPRIQLSVILILTIVCVKISE